MSVAAEVLNKGKAPVGVYAIAALLIIGIVASLFSGASIFSFLFWALFAGSLAYELVKLKQIARRICLALSSVVLVLILIYVLGVGGIISLDNITKPVGLQWLLLASAVVTHTCVVAYLLLPNIKKQFS